VAFVAWRTWVASAVVTAAQLNQDVRDNLNAWFPLAATSGVAYTSFTPVLTQSAVVAKTITYSKYTQIGKEVHFQGLLAVTGSGTANNIITVSLPVTAATGTNRPAGGGYVFDGANNVPGLAILNSTTSIDFMETITKAAVFLGQTGASFAVGLTAGMTVGFDVTYEAA